MLSIGSNNRMPDRGAVIQHRSHVLLAMADAEKLIHALTVLLTQGAQGGMAVDAAMGELDRQLTGLSAAIAD